MKEFVGKVLILVENLSVPYDRRVWGEATALTDENYKIYVICPKGKGRESAAHEVINGISIYRFKRYNAGSGLFSYMFEYITAITKMLFLSILVFFKEGFEVIHICNPPDLLFLIAIPFKLFGKRIVFDHHDLSPELYLTKTKNEKLSAVYQSLLFLEKVTFRVADIILSTNESYKSIAMSRGNVKEADIVVVRNGPDLKKTKLIKRNPKLFRGKKYLVFYAGTIGSQDGVDYFLRALDYLVNDNKRLDFSVFVMGDGPELTKLKHYASQRGLDGTLKFTGQVSHDKVLEAVSTADVCVCPDPKTSFNDNSTMIKTLEYMALGKPIVAFDLHETRVSAGDAALYAKPNDIKDFGDKIAVLLDSPVLRKRLGDIGKARIANGLSWETSKIYLYKAYELALNKVKRGTLKS